MRFFLLLLLVAFPATSCRKHVVIKPPTPPANALVDGTFITSGGTWFHTEKNTTATLKVDVSRKVVGWRYRFDKRNPSDSGDGKGYGSGIGLPTPSAPWFIYVETPERLWFFNGVDNLECGILSGQNLDRKLLISGGQLGPDSQPIIPVEIIPRLPAELQKLFPPGEAQRKRPSI